MYCLLLLLLECVIIIIIIIIIIIVIIIIITHARTRNELNHVTVSSPLRTGTLAFPIPRPPLLSMVYTCAYLDRLAYLRDYLESESLLRSALVAYAVMLRLKEKSMEVSSLTSTGNKF